MLRAALGVLLGLLVALQLGAGCSAAFLSNELPLTVTLTTPSQLLDGATESITVSDQQSFTAVFSRPVIALGSDFGQEQLPASLVPFKINCAVPGLFRWVTTNIARWDPTIQWPTDLDCTFEWNTQLKTFDGAPLQLSSPPRIALTSRPIGFDVATVSSKKADELTDKQWSSNKGMKDDELPEVPPDANITLLFSYPVQLSVLQKALQVVDCCDSNAGSQQTLKVLPCEAPYVVVDPFASPAAQAEARQNSTCAVVQLSPGLPPQGGAIIRLPRGVRYNQVSGPTTNDTDVYIHGLRRFRIPLRDNFQQLANSSEEFSYVENGISYRRMTLWLPHGLAAGTTAQQLKDRMWFCQYADPYDWGSKCSAVPFTLELVNRGQLLLTVPDLAPRQHYFIKVAGNAGSRIIKDGYGLPLEDSEAYFFTQDPAADISMPELSSGTTAMLLEPAPGGAPLPWPVVWRGKPRWDGDGRGVSVWPVDSSNLMKILRVLRDSSSPESVYKLLGQPAQSVTRTPSEYAEFKTLMLSGKPGMQFVAMPTNSTYSALTNQMLVQTSDLQYAAVSLGSSITHIVTGTTPDSAPIKGAKVSAFLVPYSDDVVVGPVCTTAADGTCTINAKPMYDNGRYGTLMVYVEVPGHGPILVTNMQNPSYYEDEQQSYPFVGTLILDRLLVNPKDDLHVTGFVQERPGAGERLILPTGLRQVNVTIMPNFKPGASESTMAFPAQLNVTYGSFHLVIPVPADANPGDYSIMLNAPRSRNATGEQTELASIQFTVGNPRPPTALLNVTVPDWSPPNSTVKVLIQASSYLGADVSDAPMVLSWSLPQASGKINVTTDAKGLASATIPLDKLPPQNASQLGDTLTLTVEWVGPTRELIKEQKTVKIANGPVRVELSRSPTTDVPGVPFMMSAQTWVNSEANSQLEGVLVEVSLRPNNSRSLENCSASAAALVPSQRCSITSGKPAPPTCLLTLPCEADFMLVACAVRFANGSAVGGTGGKSCSETPIGKNTTAWLNQPWSIMPALKLLKDRQNYTLGSTATLSWMNAFWRPASGWLVWGNGRKQQQQALANVPVGPNSVTIKVGPECQGGCKVYLVLSLPQPVGAAADVAQQSVAPLQLKVPTSKLFNPLEAMTASDSVDLAVVEDNRLNVSIKVVPREAADQGMQPGLFKSVTTTPDGRLLPVMRAGKEADIEIKVTEYGTNKPAADAEVTVVVVDEAILALLPYPLPDPAADMVSSSSISSFVKELNDIRASRADINITFSTLERRLALDPWLPLVTSVTPSTYVDYASWGSRPSYPSTSVVDVADSVYLRGFSNPLTVTPFYSWGLSQRYPAGGDSNTTDLYTGGPPPAAAAAALAQHSPTGAAAAGSKGKADAGAALRLSGEFQTVPVFSILKARTDGSASLRFTAPSNLGTFTVRAYAVSKGVPRQASKYGSNETQVIVRNPLSLVGSVPLTARVGDDFEAGVIVSAPDAARAFTVEVTATVTAANQTSAGDEASGNATAGNGTAVAAASEAEPDGSLVLLPKDPLSTSVMLSPTMQQMEVRFRYKANAIGGAGLRWVARINNADEAADALQQDVGVLGQQGPVFLATSFSLQAKSNITGRQEGVVLPQATPGSGSVSLLAGVGYLPAIQASFDALVQQQQEAIAAADDPDSVVPYGPSALNTALLPAFLARYSTATPGGLSLPPASLNASATAARALSKLTKPALGLLYYLPDNPDWLPTSASVSLNAWAAWLAAETSQQGATPASLVPNTLAELPYTSAVKTLAAVWSKAAAEQLVKNAEAAHEPPVNEAYKPDNPPPLIYNNFEELSWARLALGPAWTPPAGLDPAIAADLTLTRQLSAATTPGNTSLGVQARTGLTLTRLLEGSAPAAGGLTKAQAKAGAAKLAQLILGNVRVSGRTAYISSSPGSASAAFSEDQALALQFLALQDLGAAGREVLPKLAAYVAGGKGSIAGGAAAATCVSVGGTTPGTAGSALSVYDAVQGSTTPSVDLNVTAVSGGAAKPAVPPVVLLSASFRPGSPNLANSTTPWSALPLPQPALRFDLSGASGEVSVAAGLSFTPAKLLPFPSYRGLWVERVVQTEAGQGNVAAAALADIVTITVQLTSPDDLSGVVLEVLMPTGLEPVDPKVYRDPDSRTLCDLGSGAGSFSSWWCPAQATLRSVVTFTFGYLGAGTVSVKFKAVAATPGRFVLPPVRAYAVSQPELSGLSAAGNFTVCPTRRGANAAAATAGVAKTPGAAAFSECGADGTVLQAPLPAPKACPSDCSGNGVCNLATGKCLCNANFGGDACGTYSATRK